MNVQLYAYENGTRYELDLYQEQPIKITLSAEEITDPTQVNSSFSRQFRIPATNNNSRFFKYWYTSGVIDFDVTQKVSSDIYVDGIKYTSGQLRLVAAYDNGTSDRIDFEVVFLGETKDFSSQVGDGYMNSLDCTDSAHVLTLDWVEQSWLDPWNSTTTYQIGDQVWYQWDPNGVGDIFEADTVNTNSAPSLTSPDWTRVTTLTRRINPTFVRYIVADRGYEYNTDGTQLFVPGQNTQNDKPSEVSVTGGQFVTHENSFNKSAHPLYVTQFTPIVQVKYLIDKIFANTSYSYTANSVINEEWFQQLYVDGIGVGLPYTPNSDGLSDAYVSRPILWPGLYDPIIFDLVNQNNANAYNNQTGIYTIPVSGTYTFTALVKGIAEKEPGTGNPEVDAQIFKNGSALTTVTPEITTSPNWTFQIDALDGLTYSGTFSAGDEVFVGVNIDDFDQPPTISRDSEFVCTSTPAQVATNDLLKNDLKILDWFKSILTKFRMVMVPDVTNPNVFTIRPWQEYIGSGQSFDWTYKLDRNKDIKMEPLFYSQDNAITFIDQEDIDKTNKYNQDTFGTPFGTRRFVSGNELLSGTREITTEFAPTPVSSIEGAQGTGTNFIVPKLFEVGDETTDHGNPQRQPIVPVQRLLFWNGLAPTTTNGSAITWWYYIPGDVRSQSVYPRASYLSEIPTISTTLNLNWEKKFGYFAGNGGPASQEGEDVYQRYWRNYIQNVYSPQARKMTAYFNLDSEDMRNLTFDDVIWIKDAYWRIQKVFDAPLGEIATIKVELIKLLDYVAPVPDVVVGFDPLEYSEAVDTSNPNENLGL